MSSNLIRWGVSGALLAATGWTVSGIVALIFGVAPFGPVGSLSWYLIESSDAIGETGMMVFLVGLHLLQRPNYGRLGAAGFVLAFVGTASIFLATVIWLLTAYPVGEGAILDVLEIVALLGLLAGFPLLGIATFRARVLPRWCGVLLVAFPAVFILMSFLVDYSGAARALLGPYWLALGYALWSERGASVGQPRVEAKT
jgi:hypothetical protein